MVADLVDAKVRDVRDDDAQLGGVVDGDIVQANAISRDCNAARRRVERRCGYPLPVGQDCFYVPGQVYELVRVAPNRDDELRVHLCQ